MPEKTITLTDEEKDFLQEHLREYIASGGADSNAANRAIVDSIINKLK